MVSGILTDQFAPEGGVDIQSIQGGRHITHERHEEERCLEYMLFNEGESVDDLVIPGSPVKAEDK